MPRKVDANALAARMSGEVTSNLDTSITTLSTEIKSLEVSNKSARIQMGLKLLALRELLREKLGELTTGRRDFTGRGAPIGWNKWVKENLSISAGTARVYIGMAHDPEGKLLQQQRNAERAQLTRHKRVLSAARRAWPHLPQGERDLLVAGILALQEGCLKTNA